MAALITEVLGILNEQAERYGELVGLSEEKREAIVSNDVDALQKINQLEGMLVNQCNRLEKKRLQLTLDVATVLNQRAETLTLTRLIDLMEGQEEQEALIDVQYRIKNTMNELNELNHQNGLLIQNALEYIEFSTNMIRAQMGQGESSFPGMDEDDRPGSGFGFINKQN